MNWKYSSIGMRSLAAGLEASGRAREVLEQCQPATRDALLNPMANSWHDGSAVVDVSVVMERLLGEAAVDEVYYQAVKRSLGPVMEPFMRVMLIVTGRKPQAVFSRMNSSLAPVMKGVQVLWQQASPTSGVITVQHQDEVAPVSFVAWAGSFRYTFDLIGIPGTITPKRPSPDNREFRFDVSW